MFIFWNKTYQNLYVCIYKMCDLNVLEDEFHFASYILLKNLNDANLSHHIIDKFHSFLILTNNNICIIPLPNICMYYSVSERPSSLGEKTL